MLSVNYLATFFAIVCSGVIAQTNTVPVTGLLGNATVTTDNVIGAVYSATLPDSSLTAIRGSVVARTVPDGTGVNFQVSLSGFPAAGGPFRMLPNPVMLSHSIKANEIEVYHIHNNPISSDGNCSSAGSHVDPFERGETPGCDASLPQTCQVGDLAGKHGSINGTDFSAK